MQRMGGIGTPPVQAQAVLDDLAAELEKRQFNDDTLAPKLANLKAIARNPRDAPGVYCSAGVNLLAKAAFGSRSDEHRRSSLEAARTIPNALLLQENLRQTFADAPYIEGLLDFYDQTDPDHEFVGARILFLLTYGSQIDFVSLIQSKGLISRVEAHLKRHAVSMRDDDLADDAVTQMALVETLKLLYNLATKCPSETSMFSLTFEPLVDVLCKTDIPSRPLDPPIGQLLNALAIIEWPVQKLSNHSEGDQELLTAQLIMLLDRSTATLKPALLETMLVPLITVLRKVNAASISTFESRRLSFLYITCITTNDH